MMLQRLDRTRVPKPWYYHAETASYHREREVTVSLNTVHVLATSDAKPYVDDALAQVVAMAKAAANKAERKDVERGPRVEFEIEAQTLRWMAGAIERGDWKGD